VEGRSLSAVAHLATLGVNYAGTGILGFAKDKSSEQSLLSCFLADILPGPQSGPF
jgi:hypothetical protein